MKYFKEALSVFFVLSMKGVRGEIDWGVLDTKLPQYISDHSTTFLPYTEGSQLSGDRILIAGGCSSPDGNTYLDETGEELEWFICAETSDQLYAFNPEDESFVTLATMPRERYRHAAVAIDGKLWLVGGRDVPNDAVIPQIDVYDPVDDTWTTVGSLPDEYLTSDNGAFADMDGKFLYVVGGYNPSYSDPDALAKTFAIDVTQALENNEIIIEDKGSLNTQRGDIAAVTSQDGDHAYVVGGFSSYPCEPLNSVERYDFASDTWTFVDDMDHARGDKAVVQMNGKIFAVGGEVSHPKQCSEDPDEVPPLSAQSVAVRSVEVYNPTLDDAKWVNITLIPEHRFRFSAAAWEKTSTVYTFGGQQPFSFECKCFATSNDVVAFYDSDDSSTAAISIDSFIGTFILVAGAVFSTIITFY